MEIDPFGMGQHEPGAKMDAGKPALHLLQDFGLALNEVGKVGTGGAAKYTPHGWLAVPDGYNRYTSAMLRHFFLENTEYCDPQFREEHDMEICHHAFTAWNALARLELLLRERLYDQKEVRVKGSKDWPRT